MFNLEFLPEDKPSLGMFISGEWVSDMGCSDIEVENPANEQRIASIVEGTEAHAAQALESAHQAFATWRKRPAIERASWVSALADRVEQNTEVLARIVTLEQGKPFSEARGEVGAAVALLRYAAENARRIEGDIVTSDKPSEEIHIRRHPYGVVVGLTAWNYPLALAARKLGPALVAGNTFVLLSHEITPLSGLALAQLAQEVGLPAGVFNVITGRGAVVGRALVEHSLSSLITMTGSTRAGREIYRASADDLNVIRLELGGKAPFIVMADADIDLAVTAAVTARYANCGQICTCNERMYLHRDIADQFLHKFVSASQALRLGDPMTDVDMGPKVSGPEVEKIEHLVKRSLEAGASALLEGGRPDGSQFESGHWYAPTVLEVRDNNSPIIQEEVFGPVASAMRVSDFDEAIALANATPFGLSAYLFTADFKDLARAPYELNFGEIYLNRTNGEALQGYHTGWGHSGLGGEDGKYGFDNYLRKQTTYHNWG